MTIVTDCYSIPLYQPFGKKVFLSYSTQHRYSFIRVFGTICKYFFEPGSCNLFKTRRKTHWLSSKLHERCNRYWRWLSFSARL